MKLEPALWTQDKIENLSSYAHVVHTTAKQVISRRRENENVYKMSKNEKCTCKACKNTVFHCQICKFVRFSLVADLSARYSYSQDLVRVRDFRLSLMILITTPNLDVIN